MTSTPPAQIYDGARTPPSPCHSPPVLWRYNTRSSAKKPQQSFDTFTPSPQSTPKRKSVRRSNPISPASIDSEPPVEGPRVSYLSATAVLADGNLPTPAKTPHKKMPKSSLSARALFQEQLASTQSPRKRKLRHNGFSLESFAESSSSQEPISIHVDSRDQVPVIDPSDDNPFYVAPKSSSSASKKRGAPSSTTTTTSNGAQPTRASKRQKTNKDKKRPMDPQVEEALATDLGMVYVFRGKKVYRRFDDTGDEEEIIDPEELGLLRNRADAQEIIAPLTTLTRKAIKPKRLFQAELAEQQAKDHEEAETDHEETKTLEDDDDADVPDSPTRIRRSRTQDLATDASATKKRSPFDSWKRLKPASSSSGSIPATTSRKRTAAEALGL